jgi:hypothetical protein
MSCAPPHLLPMTSATFRWLHAWSSPSHRVSDSCSVQILHWRGDPWIAGQRASAVMDSATSLLRNSCSFTAPGVSASRIVEQNIPGHPGQSLAAVITGAGTSPMIAHVYLVSDLRNSTVVELAMWSSSPPAVDWPTMNDDQLLADMVAPLCTAYVNSCTT